MAILFSNEIMDAVVKELHKAIDSVQIITAYCKEKTFKYLDSQEQMQALLTDATSSDEVESLEEVFHIFDDEDEP